jgi:hypothetical protein
MERAVEVARGCWHAGAADTWDRALQRVSTRTNPASPKVRRRECGCGCANGAPMVMQVVLYSRSDFDGVVLEGSRAKRDFDQHQC